MGTSGILGLLVSSLGVVSVVGSSSIGVLMRNSLMLIENVSMASPSISISTVTGGSSLTSERLNGKLV